MASNLHLRLTQTSGQENNVPAQLVTKLYNIYKKVQNDTLDWDCDENSIKGTFKTGYTYDKYVNTLHSFFNNLNIIPEGYYVYFEDPLVESILLNELIRVIYPDNNYEGVIANLKTNTTGNTWQQGLKRIFYNNRDIQTFDELSKLTNVTTLAYEEFRDCQSLISIDLSRIQILNEGTVRSCVNLEYFNGQTSTKGDLSLPALKPAGMVGYNFYCWKDGSVYRGPQVKRILDLGDCNNLGTAAFFGCQTLEYVDDSIFTKLNKIGGNVFYDCTSLVINDLKLPLIDSIGTGAFMHVQIKKISELGICTLGTDAFAGCSSLTTITDEALENITSIGDRCFQNCTSLVIEDLKLPNLIKIGTHAFQNTKVKKISDLGTTITTLQGFADCKELTSVVIPPSVSILGAGAFQGCTLLNSIDLSNITTLNNYCFKNTRLSLTNNDLYNITTFNGSRDDGVFGRSGNLTLLNIETLDLPNCTYIGDNTFVGQTNIKYINLENINTLYSNKTFMGCTQLIKAKIIGTYIDLKGDWGYGGGGMFENCTNLTEVELSPNLTIITYNMFSNCTNLTTVNFNDFQENIEIFEGGNFYKSNKLTHKVFYFPRCTLFGGINKGRGSAYNKHAGFTGLDGNYSFYLPKITSLVESQLPNYNTNGYKVTYFGESIYMPYITLFSYNYNSQHHDHSTVKTLYFKNLESVTAGVFAGFTVDIIIFNNVNPPQLNVVSEWTDIGDGNNGLNLFNDDMFRTTIINDGIYVPDSAVQTYKNTSYFHNVIDKIKPLSTCPRITIEQGMNGVSGLIEEYMNEK